MEQKKDRAPKQVSDLFAVYKQRLKPPQKSVEKAALEIITHITQFELTEDQVQYTPNTRTLYLALPSVLKQEIQFKKAAILEQLQKKLGAQSAPKTIL